MQNEDGSLPDIPEDKAKSRSIPIQPTFVVAFALKETYDDLITAQQMICNKRSPQESANSITPTNSLKLLDSVVKLEQISDTPENTSIEAEFPIITAEKSFTNVKMNISEQDSDDNKIIPFLETDGTTDSSNDERTNRTMKSFEKIDQPEIIFNATNYNQRHKENKFVKRKSHKIIRPKCNKFIRKNPKINLKNRLEKYYEKVKKNSGSSEQIRDGLSDISNLVSRTTILKQASAKENLLEDTDYSNPPKHQIIPFIENDNESQASSPSTARNESFISNSSEKTLTYVSSNVSLRNEDLHSVSAKSTIENTQDTLTYKTDVINVAVAVAYNNSKTLTSMNNLNNNEKLMHMSNLTSEPDAQGINLDGVILTSKLPSNYENMNLGEISTVKLDDTPKDSKATLMNIKSSFEVSSDENLTFDMARTSSDFNESTASAFTLKKDDENEPESSDRRDTEDENKTSKRKQSILQTVINLGYYPEVTPSSSSGEALNICNQDVLISNLNQHYVVCSKDMGDHRNVKIDPINVLKKQYDEKLASPSKKTLNLPDHSRIEEMLTDDVKDTKYFDDNTKEDIHTEESKFPFSIADMFDKLVVVLDIAFQRLETTITDRIIKELKNSFTLLDRYIRSEPENIDMMNLEKGDIIVIEPSKEIISKSGRIKEADGCAQCDLVQSKVIDEIMYKLSTQSRKVIEPERIVKSYQHLKTKWFKDYFEGSKASTAVTPNLTHVKERDTDTIVTSKTFVKTKLDVLKCMFSGSTKFVKANLVVISSVPVFILGLFLIYGLLLLIV